MRISRTTTKRVTAEIRPSGYREVTGYTETETETETEKVLDTVTVSRSDRMIQYQDGNVETLSEVVTEHVTNIADEPAPPAASFGFVVIDDPYRPIGEALKILPEDEADILEAVGRMITGSARPHRLGASSLPN